MTRRLTSAIAAAALALCQPVGSLPARADNPMGYRLVTTEEAATLPRAKSTLGLVVEGSPPITSGGLTFDVMRVTQVRRGSTGAQAGFKVGDQIIAVDGRVFPTIRAFASYVGSVAPGNQITIDYMPAGGGPQQAQRVPVTLGAAGGTEASSGGMSTGTKVAIGVGAAALFGCYELGCFSHRSRTAPANAGGQFQPAQPR